MKTPSISRRIWVIVSTVAVIGGFFAYYFFVYMESRREELEAKKFRALAQYAENIRGHYSQRTKKLEHLCRIMPCVYHDDDLKTARHEVIEAIVDQSDFSELVFEVDGLIEGQTFNNAIDESVIDTLTNEKDALIKRKLEVTVNDEDYVLFVHSFSTKDKFSTTDTKWMIFAFCAKDEFESQVKSVELVYVFTASLFLILILLIMPLLKLWIMNELEKLQTVNVWFCGFSLVVGSAFLLLIVLMTNDLMLGYESFATNDFKKSRKKRIEVLSDRIQEKFISELKTIYVQLQQSKYYNQALGRFSKVHGNVQKDTSVAFTKYPYFNEMLWIKGNGDQDFALATHELDTTDVVNLNGRTYFSNALDPDLSWRMPDSPQTTQTFALQSIRSYIDQHNYEAGFGIKYEGEDSARVKVIAIATKLHSIMDPLLPPGYQFVVIDQTGKVWFHSTINKNLNENFFDETGRNNHVVAAVNGRLPAWVSVHYDRATFLGHIKPIQNTELFLIVLHDNEYFTTPIVLTVGFASILVFILLGVQGVHQLILVLSTNRFSLLKIRKFFLTWLRPQTEKKEIYHDAVYVQLILLLLVFAMSLFFYSLDLIVCFLTLPVFLTMYHYFSLKRSYIVKERKRQSRRIFTHPFFVSSSILVLFINLSAIHFLTIFDFLAPLFIQLLFLAILVMSFRVKKIEHINDEDLGEQIFWILWRKAKTKTDKSKAADATIQDVSHQVSMKGFPTLSFFKSVRWLNQPYNWIVEFISYQRMRVKIFENSYQAFLFLWLMLASIVPTYYFYRAGYYEERKIWTRFVQLEAAQRQEQRELSLRRQFKKRFDDNLIDIGKMGNYLRATCEIHDPGSEEFHPIKESRFHDLMFKIAPPLKGLAERTRAVRFPTSADDRWVSRENDLNYLLDYKTGEGEHRSYQSELLPYRTFKGDYWPILLLAFVIGLIVLYKTLRFCITHIFGLGLLEVDNKVPVIKIEGAERCFIVGLPHSGETKFVDGLKKTQRDAGKIVSDNDLNDGLFFKPEEDSQVIIVRNFHFDLNNHESNQKKLELLESFIGFKDKAVIIVSNIDPSAILEFYDKVAQHYRNEKKDHGLTGSYRKCRQAYRKWKNILSDYSIHYYPLKKEDNLHKNKFISHELNHGEYLPQLKGQLKENISTRRERELMILQVENLSKFYYTSIWNCLTSPEKFLLHDLANDGFVNMRNMKIIRALGQKGLLKATNSLRIMNRSFNNFILSVVEEDKDVTMEEEMRKKGSWNTLHLVLVITIVSIIVFLGIAQQELFKNFQSIIAVMAALLALLGRFGGVFSGFKGKE